MPTTNRDEAITRIQALAIEERLAHPEDDDALIAAVLDHIERNREWRLRAERQKRRLLAGAAILGILVLDLAVWAGTQGKLVAKQGRRRDA